MLIVSDGGDWTASVPNSGVPASATHLRFLWCARHPVRNVHLPAERHDFGPNKRNAVYQFFIDVFGLDKSMLDEK